MLPGPRGFFEKKSKAGDWLRESRGVRHDVQWPVYFFKCWVCLHDPQNKTVKSMKKEKKKEDPWRASVGVFRGREGLFWYLIPIPAIFLCVVTRCPFLHRTILPSRSHRQT